MTEERMNIEAIKMAIFELLDKGTSFEKLAEKFEVTKSTLNRYYNMWGTNTPDSQPQSSRDIHISSWKELGKQF